MNPDLPCDVEPNVFYEPRTATAPFFIISDDAPYDEYVGRPYDTRAEAEEAARLNAETDGKPYYVVGCVSISSVAKPVPVKASTRALV